MEMQTANGTLTIEKIPTGRRISEILYEQNSSPSAFRERVTFAKRDTVRHCLNDTRHISPKELQEMADLLGYSVDRILQNDTEKDALALRVAVRSKSSAPETIDLGKKLLKVAIGWSEKFDCHNDLGSAYYYLGQVEKAHEHYLEALNYAEKIRDKFHDIDRLYMAMSNLLITYRLKKEFITLDHLLNKLEPSFVISNPKRAGAIAYHRAVLAEQRRDFDEAEKKWSESLQHYEKTESDELIGRGFQNLAYFLFKMSRHLESRNMFARAIKLLTPYPRYLQICLVNCTKNLIKLQEYESALKMIESVRSLKDFKPDSNTQAQLYVLQAVAEKSPLTAEKALEVKGISDKTKLVACLMLMDYCRTIGDGESMMRYHGNVSKILNSTLPNWEEV